MADMLRHPLYPADNKPHWSQSKKSLIQRKTAAAAGGCAASKSGGKHNASAESDRISLADRLAAVAHTQQNAPVARLGQMDVRLYLRGLPRYNSSLDPKLYDSMANGIWDELELPDHITSCTVNDYIYCTSAQEDDDYADFYTFKAYQRFYEMFVKPFAA